MVPASQPTHESQTGLLASADVVKRSNSSGSSSSSVIEPHSAAVKDISISGGSKDTHDVKDGVRKGFDGSNGLPAHSHLQHAADLDTALRKVSCVVLPLLFGAVSLNYLDRTALSFASLQLNADLELTTQQYGLAAATFALGYGLGHMPSAYLGMKYGVRTWLAVISMSWGLVAMCGALVRSANGLYWQRAVLGLTEAGAMPCAMHLLAQFYPRARLTQPMTCVSLGLTLSTIIAPPLAAGFMSINAGGLKGWQWLFILEGGPSVLLGLVMLLLLPSRPLNGRAWMLSDQEQQMLEQEVHGKLAASPSKPEAAPGVGDMLRLMWEAAQKPLLWYLTLVGFLWVLCVHSLNAFMPIIIKNMLAGTAAVGSTSTGGSSALNTRNAMLLSAIPYAMAAVMMSLTAWHSDRVKERTLHVGVTALIGAVFWLCFGPMYHLSFAVGFVSLVFAMMFAYAQVGIMYAKVTEQLDARHVAIGVGMFNAIGAALGGFLGPYVTGAVVQRLGSFVQATVIQGSFLATSGCLAIALGLYELQVRQRDRDTKLPGEAGGSSGSH